MSTLPMVKLYDTSLCPPLMLSSELTKCIFENLTNPMLMLSFSLPPSLPLPLPSSIAKMTGEEEEAALAEARAKAAAEAEADARAERELAAYEEDVKHREQARHNR